MSATISLGITTIVHYSKVSPSETRRLAAFTIQNVLLAGIGLVNQEVRELNLNRSTSKIESTVAWSITELNSVVVGRVASGSIIRQHSAVMNHLTILLLGFHFEEPLHFPELEV